MDFVQNADCTNVHQNVPFSAKKRFDLFIRNPDGSKPRGKNASKIRWNIGIKLIQEILAEAEQTGNRVRAVGSRWSLSEVGKCTDYILNTGPMNVLINPDLESNVGDAHNFVLLQAGVKIAQLNTDYLFDENLSLSTSGASDGQTIAGAISTGTHGGAWKTGAMQDFVRGLHIITSSSEHFWIEPKEKYLTVDFFAQNFVGNTQLATRINNDEIFNAALVSFGSFGVIHGVLLEVEPLYYLSVIQKSETWSFVKDIVSGPTHLENLNIATDPFHLEFGIIPSPNVALDDKKTFIKAIYKYPFDANIDNKIEKQQESKLLNFPNLDMIELVGKITNILPFSTLLAQKIFESKIVDNYPTMNGKPMFFPNDLFGGSQFDEHPKGMSTEIGFDANDTKRVTEIILDVADSTPFIGVVALRYIKKSRATLAFTRFDTTCAVELPALFSDETKAFYEALWQRLDDEGIIFTNHWGQMSNLDNAKIRKRWTDEAVDSWLSVRRQLLKTQAQRDMFSNDFLEQCGLNEQIA